MRAKFLFALIVGAGIFSASGVVAPRLARAEVCPPVCRQTLLADEINRRLNRMGISFNRLRLPHPYDPVGEVC